MASVEPDAALTLYPMPPTVQALALHLPMWGLLLAAVVGLQTLDMIIYPGPLCLAEGAMAGLATRWLGLPRWWQGINLVFFPALWLTLQADLPAYWYLLGFLALALTSLGSVRTRVPLYLSSRRAAEALLRRLPAPAGVRVMDLGCGLGGPLASLARQRPDLELHGVEAAPLNWLWSKLRLRGRAQVRLGSLWDEDLSHYDVVYAYLSPDPMARLWDKARQEMRPGSLFVSNTFEVPGMVPDETVELHDLSHARLLLWRMR